MKIASSNISMGSARIFSELDSTSEKLNAWIGKKPDTAALNSQDRVVLGANAPLPPPEPVKSKEEASDQCKSPTSEDNGELTTKDGYIYVLEKIIEALTGKKLHIRHIDQDALSSGNQDAELPPEFLDLVQRGQEGWGVEYDRTSVHSESEQTSFATEGVIKTADGQEIGFSLSLQMSREYTESQSESYRAGDAAKPAKKVDPLVLNFDGNASELTNSKFAFDLDQDGAKENISFVGSGSGILVFDRNRDGIVNNGSELFGPSTGNGFSELASLDSDQNGWIDENDAAYKDLSVWTKTEDGKDVLTGLKDKDVGAIYLGNVQSQFDLKNGATLNGQVARTGIFAKEDGGVGTVQQIDLVT